MNKDLEWIRNYIFGDEKHEPMVTYIPYMMEVDRHINAVKAELDRYKKALGVAMGYFQELDGFQVLSAQDFKLPKEIANVLIDKKRAESINLYN